MPMSVMANGARGEAVVSLAGEERRVCLTLGALAEMETTLACAGVGALAERLRAPSAGDLTVVLGALLRGGGEAEAEAVASAAGFAEAAEAVARGLAAAV